LILDNVENPSIIEPLLAKACDGKFLITSRTASGWREATTVALNVLGPEEALDLFNRIATSGGPRDMTGAAEVCAELGYLPLAVEQAAAYLAQNPLTTPREYLAFLRDYPGVMYDAGSADLAEERTIAQIWYMTLDKIAAKQPLANDLLRALAWYSTDAIPDVVPAALLTGAATPPEINSALGLLAAYSMISVDRQARTYSVHRLVQAFLRTANDDDPHRTAELIDRARDFATHLHLALPATTSDPRDRETWDALIPHIDHLFGNAGPQDYGDAHVLSSVGDYLIGIGQPQKAIKYLEQALAGYVEHLSAGHRSTLTCAHNLATAYHGVADYDRAIPFYEVTAKARALTLGSEDKNTLITVSNLGCAYSESGTPEKGIPLLRFVVEKVDNGLQAMVARRNLCRAYQDAGDLEQARAWGEEALTFGVRSVGEDAPEVLRTRHDLVHIYRQMADNQAVVQAARAVLESGIEVSDDALSNQHCIALALAEVGEHADAVGLLQKVVAEAVEVLGEGHEDTAEYHRSLASVLRRIESD
jgi:tetratricopeptide (TPR) repeat protein